MDVNLAKEIIAQGEDKGAQAPLNPSMSKKYTYRTTISPIIRDH